MAPVDLQRTPLLTALVLGLFCACSGAPTTSGDPGGMPPDPGHPPPVGTPNVYAGNGFVVHEWGTNTLVVGSDGSVQRGLHHEEEDLPAFVYDRLKAGTLTGSTSVELKMETPVTYFYAPQPLTATVTVSFPLGVLTQFYPAVRDFAPHVANTPVAPYQTRDPVLDPGFPFQSPTCLMKYGALAAGVLHWGEVQVLGRQAAVDAALPAAPLDRYTWAHARAVQSNPLRISGAPGGEQPQTERFLFYRGLGHTPIAAQITSGPGGALAVKNQDPALPLGAVFVLNVGAGGGAFQVVDAGVAPGAVLNLKTPSLQGAPSLDVFSDALAKAMSATLAHTGLYTDEAQAMVNTWRRQWFRTPGVRLLYLSPQAWTDAQIPLAISPPPDALVRVMVIRTEVLTPELEEADTAQAQALDGDAAAQRGAEQYFSTLGRFAEPRLRRALSILGHPGPHATQYLALIATANTSSAAGE